MQDNGIMINVPGKHLAIKGKKKKCNQAKPNENYAME